MAEEAEDVVEHEAPGAEEAEPEAQAEQTQAAAFDPEAVARLAGWAPRDQWKGDPADWKEADAFLIDTAAVNKSLRRDVKDLRKTVERTARVAERIIQSESQRAREEARAELRHAVQAGDEEAAELAAQRLERVAATAPAMDDPIAEFAQRNAWFETDLPATQLARGVAEKWARLGHGAAKQIEEAEKEVRRRFPELFDGGESAGAHAAREDAAQQRSQPHVQGGQRTPRTAVKDPVASLPPEARKAGEQFVRMSKGRMTLADYAKLYQEENA